MAVPHIDSTNDAPISLKPGSPKSSVYNCPNCGAEMSGEKCPCCGTVLYDFGNIDLERPQYIKIRHGEKIFICHVRYTDCEITSTFGEDNTVRLEFNVLPDSNGHKFITIDERKLT